MGEALLLERKDCKRSSEKATIVDVIRQRIEGYLKAQRNVMVVYNVHESNLEKCCDLTPGAKAPTITNLKSPGWYSVSSLIDKSNANTTLDGLATNGGQDILCMPLANTRL